jgi:DNA-binding Xre family transcriptional regulator
LSVTWPTTGKVCQLLDRQRRKFVSYLSDNGEVCQLLVRQWRKLVSYLSDNGRSLSVTWPTMEEVCQLLDQQWRDFVSYLTDNGGILSVTWPTMEEVCQLLDRQWRKFVSYLTDYGGSLSVTWLTVQNVLVMFLEEMHFISSLNVVNTPILGRICVICWNRFRMKIGLALLTRGNQNLTYEDNCLIFRKANKFIRWSKRFLIV